MHQNSAIRANPGIRHTRIHTNPPRFVSFTPTASNQPKQRLAFHCARLLLAPCILARCRSKHALARRAHVLVAGCCPLADARPRPHTPDWRVSVSVLDGLDDHAVFVASERARAGLVRALPHTARSLSFPSARNAHAAARNGGNACIQSGVHALKRKLRMHKGRKTEAVRALTEAVRA
eukprot:3596291-Rhodomonas_salina.2